MAFDDDDGVVLCCTSILADVRTRLADAASQMGATLRLDLTSDVTHLLVGRIDTPKYRYVARERPDIKVLRAEWVEAVRAAWMAGEEEEVDLAALERAHVLPVFFGLKVCVTKFATLEAQTYFADAVAAHGGAFSGDLTRDVTHLVAAVPQGAKYTHAKQWGVAVVSEKWFADSLQRGMALDESLYPPEAPEEEQGIGAFRMERKPVRTSLGKRAHEGEEPGEAGKRKVRRVASMRLEGHSQGLWQDMSGQETRAGTKTDDAWKDEQAHANDDAVKENSVDRSVAPTLERNTSAVEEMQGLFHGQHILIHGFEPKRASRIRDFLEPNGARIVRTTDELEAASAELSFRNRYLLTPHATPDEELALPEVPPGTVRTTEWWVERCIHSKRLLDPEDDILSRPLGNVAIPGLNVVFVSSTGFTGVDLRQTAETIKLMNAEYQETLCPSTQILICASDSIKKEKAYYAARHSIPAVRAAWLWDTLKAGKKAPLEKYRITLPAAAPGEVSQPLSARSPAPSGPDASKTADAVRRSNEKPRHLSSSRRRHATPSLVLKPSRSNDHKRGPFIHEDDDEEIVPSVCNESASLDDGERTFDAPLPLSEISPNASPQRSEPVTIDHVLDKTGKLATDDEVSHQTEETSQLPSSTRPRREDEGPGPAISSADHLSEQITSLMERRRASRPEAMMNTMSPQKRKSRPLGRNLSGRGNRSVSASARSQSMSHTFPAEIRDSHSSADGFSFPPRLREEETSSTQVGYETLEMEAHRKQMSEKLGTDLLDASTGTRLASLGTVKDSEIVTRKTTRERTKGRQRQQMKS